MNILIESPTPITLSTPTTQRDARLLVAGEYPAKGLTVTEADIDALVANFCGPVPVKVEHMDTPLDPLGQVERVWRDGKALMGRVAFPAALAAFLSDRERRSGAAARLSVGLLRGPAWRLLEASLTLTPHVPGAMLLSDGATPLSDGERAELAGLRRAVREQRVDAQVASLKASGRLIPATEALARVLLTTDDSSLVTLSDGTSQPVAGAFLRFLHAQPPLVRLGELARAPQGAAVALSGGASGAAAETELETELETERERGMGMGGFTDDEREILRRLGVRPEDVARTLRADRDGRDDRSKRGAA